MLTDDVLPEKVDPFRFADNGVTLEGTLCLEGMRRLIPSLATLEGEILAKLVFGVDWQGIRFLHAQFSTVLMLECQRCMDIFEHKIIGDFSLGLIQTDKEAESLPLKYDPLLVSRGSLNVQDIFEEELIIRLPIVPMHLLVHCKVTLPLELGVNISAVTKKDNPFKAIEFLKVR